MTPSLMAEATDLQMNGSTAPALREVDVLIVDDEADVRETLEIVLRDEGFTVATAADGHDALELLHGLDCRLILLDLMMPGMSGWQFQAALQCVPLLKDVPLFIVSGTDDVAEQARRLGVTGWFTKPVPLDQLLKTIHSIARE